MAEAPVVRHAVRALMLADDHLLLQHIRGQDGGDFWITPGGAVDQGESELPALSRELYEETGATQFEIGPCVWFRRHRFVWSGRHFDQRERFYLVTCLKFEPQPVHLQPEEVDFILGHRWWPPDEILVSSETFAPRNLGKELRHLLTVGPPSFPYDVGI